MPPKRYRYTGMERDDETGLQIHGVRFYAPWLGRWCSADPIGLAGGIDRYAYAHGNPATLADTTGAVPQAPDPDFDGAPAGISAKATGLLEQIVGEWNAAARGTGVTFGTTTRGEYTTLTTNVAEGIDAAALPEWVNGLIQLQESGETFFVKAGLPNDSLANAMSGGSAENVGRYQPTTASFARARESAKEGILAKWKELPTAMRKISSEKAARQSIGALTDKTFESSAEMFALPIPSDKQGGVISLDSRLLEGPITIDDETASLGSTAAHEILLHGGGFAEPPVTGTFLGSPLRPLRTKVRTKINADLMPTIDVLSAIEDYNAELAVSAGHNKTLFEHGLGYPTPQPAPPPPVPIPDPLTTPPTKGRRRRRGRK